MDLKIPLFLAMLILAGCTINPQDLAPPAKPGGAGGDGGSGSQQANITPQKLFTMEEVARHNTKDGCWMVTIARPLDLGPDMASLEMGKKTYMAFAVWDGVSRNTGSRKMRSGWIPLLLEER